MGEETRDKERQLAVMEEIKSQTEQRKLRSQALEKTERLKKKTKIREKKEQKAEVKRKIEDTLPITAPPEAYVCCNGVNCTNTTQCYKLNLTHPNAKFTQSQIYTTPRYASTDTPQQQTQQAKTTSPTYSFHCSACTNEYLCVHGDTYMKRGKLVCNEWELQTHNHKGVGGGFWVCLDEEKHLREWMVKERRVMVKSAFQDHAKVEKNSKKWPKLRKLEAAKKFEFSSDKLDDDFFSEEEESDTEETWQKND